MKSIDIKKRAKLLSSKTESNSITPKEVGDVLYDSVEYMEEIERNGSSLGIRKVYASVAAMEADGTTPNDFWGKKLKRGNLVVIYDGGTGIDNNKVFAFQDPGWNLATKLDAAYATKSEINEINVSRMFPTGGIGGTNKYTLATAIAKIPDAYKTIGIKCSFIDEVYNINIYKWCGGAFDDINRWIKVLGAEDIKPVVDDLKAYAYQNTAFTSNGDFNLIVKEIYIPQGTDVSSVEMVRIYNGYAGLYGLKCYGLQSNVVLDLTCSIKQQIVTNVGGAKAFFDLTKLKFESYKDFKLKFNPIVHEIIYSRILFELDKDSSNTFAYATGKVNILIEDKGTSSTIIIPPSYRLYAKGTNIYLSSKTLSTKIELQEFQCAYIELGDNSSPDAPASIKIGSYTLLEKRKDAIVLFVRDEKKVRYGELLVPSLNDKVDEHRLYCDRLINGGAAYYVEGLYLSSNGVVDTNGGTVAYQVSGIKKVKITTKTNNVIYAFLKDRTFCIGITPDYATGSGRKILASNQNVLLDVPLDAQWLYVSDIINQQNWSPSEILFDSELYNYALSLKDNIYTDIKKINTNIVELEKQIQEKPTIAPLPTHNETYFDKIGLSPNRSHKNNDRPLIYEGDTKKGANYLVNTVVYPDGVIIGARAGVGIVKIGLDGAETTLLSIMGATDWRCLYMDSNMNVFASPHASTTTGSPMPITARGLYKLTYGGSSFTKVISLYNPSSDIPSEKEDNDDTIWTMCEDNEGVLYAGVYSHTKHHNPAIYKSVNGGDTWTYAYNFNTSKATTNGHHIHSIIYNEYDNALYAIVGEVNTVFKSTDKSETWIDLNASCKNDKGSAMIATPTGVLIGSDGAYNCAVAKLYPNGVVKDRGVFSANTIFAFRKSDLTGRIYAFCKIDSSVASDYYFPPIESINNNAAIEQWKTTANPSSVKAWTEYNNKTKIMYPEDAILPQHYMIIASDDDGETWYLLYRKFAGAYGASGFWTTGYFRNGECLTGQIIKEEVGGLKAIKPLVISERQGKYSAQGLSIEDSIYVRTNAKNILSNDDIL